MKSPLLRLLLCAVALQGSLRANERANEHAQPATRAYDLIADAYQPSMDTRDPFAWPMKVRSLAVDSYTFWRGSKEHFFRWSREQCSDWLGDRTRFIPTHGDPHFGNVGSYASRDKLGEMELGFVDFDESTLLPPEMELLQARIMIRLSAAKAKLPWTRRLETAVAETMLDSYRAAYHNPLSARRQAGDCLLAEALFDAEGTKYRVMLREMTDSGRFRSILGKPSSPTDLLRPANELNESIARALAQAAAEYPALGAQLRYTSADSFRAAICDTALRTRIKSSGSQGLKKYFVLLRSPLREFDHDVVLYLKQEVPAPAERLGISPAAGMPAGARVAAMANALSEPAWFINASAQFNGESYWLTMREPWSDELDASAIRTRDDLLAATRLWCIVAAGAHRAAGMRDVDWLGTNSIKTIAHRADAFLVIHNEAYADFITDRRVTELVRAADESVARLAREP